MKHFLLTFSLSLFLFSATYAQDLESATNLCKDGNAALSEGNTADALKKFEAALEQADIIGPDADEISTNCKTIIPNLYLAIGKEQANAKEMDNAVATLKTAIEKGKEYNQDNVVSEATSIIPQLYMAEGNTLLNSGQFAEASVMYNKAVEFDPTNGMAYLRIGQASIRANDEASAIAALEKAKEYGQASSANKELSKFYLKKSAAYLKAKKFGEAADAAKLSNDAQESAQAYSIIGKSSIALKKYDDAISAFETYLAKSPNAKDANQTMYQLASAYEAKGDKGKACGYYKQILTDPQFKDFATHKVNNELKCN